jgi:hypothetical protein
VKTVNLTPVDVLDDLLVIEALAIELATLAGFETAVAFG